MSIYACVNGGRLIGAFSVIKRLHGWSDLQESCSACSEGTGTGKAGHQGSFLSVFCRSRSDM